MLGSARAARCAHFHGARHVVSFTDSRGAAADCLHRAVAAQAADQAAAGRQRDRASRAYPFEIGSVCYIGRMTRDQVKEILDRVLTWPPERQADLAHMVELMEEQDRSDLRLSDEQVAEVRRRLAEKNPETVTLAEFKEHLRRRYGV